MKNYWTQSASNIYVAAHRGWSAVYPENTMEAFKAAVELNVDQIETDVRITKDGELVLMHDAKVDRTTDGTGKVCDMTLAELKALDAGIKKGEQFRGARVPTFVEFMDLVRDLPDMTVDIELKEYPTEGWEETSYSVCDRVLKLVDEYGYTDRCVINTFSGKLHEYIFRKYGRKYRQHVYFPQRHLGETTIDPYSYGYCVCMFGDGDHGYQEGVRGHACQGRAHLGRRRRQGHPGRRYGGGPRRGAHHLQQPRRDPQAPAGARPAQIKKRVLQSKRRTVQLSASLY